MNNSDPDRKIIDFDKIKRREQNRHRARRRAGWITAGSGRIDITGKGAVLIVGVFLFIQFREAVEDKGFWQNFNSAAVAAL